MKDFNTTTWDIALVILALLSIADYMLVEANRFKKDLLTLPRVEQGSVSEQVKPHSSGEVVHAVAGDVVQTKGQPS